MNRIEYPELDEVLYTTTLENGLDVLVLPRKGFSKKLAYFMTDYGSAHTRFSLDGVEYTAPDGVAHYLEHKLFDMPGGRDISAEFAQKGAMTNAFTSYDMTAYYFSCTDHFDDCLKLLLEFVSTPYFTEESVRKEQGIIDQEIGMNADTPESVIFENMVRSLYHTHPVRVPILGTSDTIRQITPEVLHLCHRAFYTPGNMLLCVVGDVDPESVEEIARQVLGTQPQSVGIKLPFGHEPMTHVEESVCAAMEVAMPMFSLAFKSEPLGKGDDSILQEMVADLSAELLFGESSPLYLKLYEEGIIDASFGGGFETMDGCAMLLCTGDSDHPEAVRDAILARAREISEEGISEADFLRLKRSAFGRRIRGLDSFDSTCFRLCAYHFSDFAYFRFPEIYRQIQTRQIRDFITQVVRPERCALSVITPFNQEESHV